MNLYREIINVLGLLGLGGVITALVTYILHRRQHRAERLFDAKKDAYVQTINAVSGLRDTIIIELKRKAEDIETEEKIIEEVSPEAVLDYLVRFKKEIAAAKLFAVAAVADLLNDVDDLVVDLSVILNGVSKDENAQLDDHPLKQKFDEWFDHATELEEKLITAMQHDLRIRA